MDADLFVTNKVWFQDFESKFKALKMEDFIQENLKLPWLRDYIVRLNDIPLPTNKRSWTKYNALEKNILT